MNELALFAGAGGGILGGHLLGWRTVCAVELDAYARSVLLARQRDGLLPRFPLWDDVRTFDGKPWRGSVEVVSGGFPCTDISSAGGRAGIEGEHSGLWVDMARIIGEVAPEFAFVENASDLVVRGLDRVLGDLADLGFDARWGVMGASAAGLPHERKRTWIVAHAQSARLAQRWDEPGEGAGADRPQKEPRRGGLAGCGGASPLAARLQWTAESVLLRNAHGLANRVERMRAVGNGQVPRVAASAFRMLARLNTHNDRIDLEPTA
jgi:DNA (cytosine-5)-methyltransferase 1